MTERATCRSITKAAGVTTMIEFADILLEQPPHPFWKTLRQVGIERAVAILPRFHADWREQSSERPWHYAPLAL
jgi:mannonate dehydratase